jgi:hypothetical protein
MTANKSKLFVVGKLPKAPTTPSLVSSAEER